MFVVMKVIVIFQRSIESVVYCIVEMMIWPSFWIGIGGLSVQALF